MPARVVTEQFAKMLCVLHLDGIRSVVAILDERSRKKLPVDQQQQNAKSSRSKQDGRVVDAERAATRHKELQTRRRSLSQDRPHHAHTANRVQ